MKKYKVRVRTENSLLDEKPFEFNSREAKIRYLFQMLANVLHIQYGYKEVFVSPGRVKMHTNQDFYSRSFELGDVILVRELTTRKPVLFTDMEENKKHPKSIKIVFFDQMSLLIVNNFVSSPFFLLDENLILTDLKEEKERALMRIKG